MMISDEQVRRILADSVWAPSGDNCQPWKYIFEQDRLKIYHLPIRGEHPLNIAGAASLISLGCVLESIRVSASIDGFQSKVTFGSFPTDSDALWATVEFQEDPTLIPDSLAGFLRIRATDRRLFKGGEISDQSLESVGSTPISSLYVTSNVNEGLIEAILSAEELMVEHDDVLPNVLKWTRMSMRSARETKDGLSWRNMGVQPWEVPVLPVIKHFPKSLGLFRSSMRKSHRARVRQQLQSSAGLVCVTVKEANLTDLVGAGQLMMRAWLQLTSLGYGVQPLTFASLIPFAAHLGPSEFKRNVNWMSRLNRVRETVANAFQVPTGEKIVWMIRTGISDPLPENLRTFRQDVEKVLSIPGK